MATKIIRTVRASGGDETLLSSAIAWGIANHSDLVSLDEELEIQVFNDFAVGLDDSYTLGSTDFTQDATHRLTILGVAGTEGSGIFTIIKTK